MARKSTIKAEGVSASAPREPTVKSVASRKSGKPKKEEAPVSVTPVEITDEMIRARAHQLWLSEAPGSELDHWFQARRQLEVELGR